MANQVLPINQLDQAGVIPDAPPSALAANAFSNARNVRFRDNAVRKIEGEVLLNEVAEDTNLDSIYLTSGNKLSSAKHILYWPNPNLGDLAAYYIYVMGVENSAGSYIADRVYIEDEEGNRADITPSDLVNSDGYKGFDPDGNWQHTLFAGGFAIIINNGIQKPHYILDPISSVDVNNVSAFAELPGWDSYNIDVEVFSISDFDTHQSDFFDLGQKIDFANFYLDFKVNGTSFTAASGNPAGTGTPNTANFVPGILPSSVTISSNQFEIYTSNATNTTVVACTNLSSGDSIKINIISRQQVNVRANIVRAFGNLLVAGDLIEVDSVSGDVLRRLSGVVRTSDIAVTGSIPNNWNPFAAGVSTADEFTLSDTNIVKDMKSIQGNLYIYTNNSIHSMALTNNPLAPVRFNLITDNYGALTTEAIVEYDGKHLVVGSNDIYSFPGHPGNIQSLASGRIRDYFYTNLNPLHEANLFTLLNNPKDEIWICYPTIKSITGECDEAIIWNYRLNNWTIRDLDEVISGDIAPIRGGGIPLTTIDITSGNSGSDEPLNEGRQEVQTMTIAGQMETSHSGVKQVQEYTSSTFFPDFSYTTAYPETLEIAIDVDPGPNIDFAKANIRIGASGDAPTTGLNEGDTVFTRSSAPFGGLEIVLVVKNASLEITTITGADLFSTNDGLAKTQQQVTEALRDYINGLNDSTINPLADWTATATRVTEDNGVTHFYRLELVSEIPGTRRIYNSFFVPGNSGGSGTTYTSYIKSYVGGLTSVSGAHNDAEQVSVTATLVNQTPAGYARGTGSLVPYYNTNKGFQNNYGNTSNNDRNGHVTSKDTVNNLQVFIGGWTSAGAGGPDGSSLNSTYTIDRSGKVYFILTGSGGGGADHNYGGGAASAVQGYINNAQAGDRIVLTAAGANRFDSFSGAGYPGKASRIRWYRGSTLKADINAPGGRAADNGSAAGTAAAVTPSSAPSGVTYTRVLRGEGSTNQVYSGETNRGGSRNGGRGFFARYGTRIYGGRWQTSSLRWTPSQCNWGDGTQAHSDTPRCCTWNAIPPGVVFLWQDGTRTDFTVTNNRDNGNHPLQLELYNLQLAAGGSVISYLDTGDSASRSIIGNHVSNLSWSGQTLGTQISNFNVSGTGSATNVGGTGIDITVTQNGSVYDITATNNFIAPATLATPIVDSDFQIGETQAIYLGKANDSWTITGTYLTNTGTSTDIDLNTEYDTSNSAIYSTGNGIYGVSEEDSPPITVRFRQTSGGYVPDGFDKRIVLNKRDPYSSSTSANDTVEEVYDELITDPIFQGQDPSNPASVQPSAAYYYVEKIQGTVDVPVSIRLKAVKPTNSNVDTSATVLSTLVRYNEIDYSSTTFGGVVNTSTLTINDGNSTANITPPTVRAEYDNTYLDIVIAGTNVSMDDVGNFIAQELQDTGVFTTTSSLLSSGNAGAYKNIFIEATRTQAFNTSGQPSELIKLSIQNDPDDLLLDTLTPTRLFDADNGYFTETTSGVNPSIGAGTATLTLNESAFLPAYNVVVPLTGIFGNAVLDSTEIAALIRATPISGWTLSGTGSDVIFTTTEKYSVNRVDDGNGTGTVNPILWSMTPDDYNGDYEYASDPLQAATAVETTAGIPVRYTQPTVIRIQYSDLTFQDYVFGGTNNGTRNISDPYISNIYSGGDSSTTYSATDIADELETEIKRIGGRTLAVERTGNNLRVLPIQYSTTGLYILSATLVQQGTTATTPLTVEIPDPIVDATLVSSFSSFGRFDPDRPWPTDQINASKRYPIFIQTSNDDNSSRIRAADIGYSFGADPANGIQGLPYASFVERTELGITPELDTEQIARAAIQSTGGTATELNGTLYYPTLYLRMSPTDYTAEPVDLVTSATLVNDYRVSQDYKIDTKVTGRFINYRIDDATEDATVTLNEYAWGIPSIQFEINKAGER